MYDTSFSRETEPIGYLDIYAFGGEKDGEFGVTRGKVLYTAWMSKVISIAQRSIRNTL